MKNNDNNVEKKNASMLTRAAGMKTKNKNKPDKILTPPTIKS
jgi:hypothetical protein